VTVTPREILKQVRRIEIRTRRAVNDIFAGEYKSVFKGRGMEFSEVREYIPGDDIRTIDWNVTARSGHPFVKKFMEERELTLMLMFDASSSTAFGTGEKFKNEIAAEISALLAFSAIKNNDRVGLIIFTDQVEKYIPPKKGRMHVLRLVRELLYFKPKHKKTNIGGALEYLMHTTKRKAIVFLLSDFIADDFQRQLTIANRRHDVVAIALTDRRERSLPSLGYVYFEDPETNSTVYVNTGSYLFKRDYKSRTEKYMLSQSGFFNGIGLDYISINTHNDYVYPLFNFFKQRERKKGV